MSGRNDKREGESTFLKVAGAAVAAATVAGGLYALFKQPEPEAAEAFTAQSVQRPNKEVWTKPRPGWVKLNVDGSLLPQSAGCGGVLRDSSGKWVSGFAVKLEPRSHYPDETEKEAIFIGLQWVRGRRVKKVVVESDNRGIVDFVKSGSRTIDPLICKIRDLLSCGDWEKATLSWIPGDANRVADKLADIARGLSSFQLREFDSPPLMAAAMLPWQIRSDETKEHVCQWPNQLYMHVEHAFGRSITINVLCLIALDVDLHYV